MSGIRRAREWDAPVYDRLAAPLTTRGAAVVARADPAPDGRVLDAGCGTGQVSALLLERLPRGRLTALDGSRAMLAEARARLGGDPRVEFVLADLTRPLPLDEAMDAVISTSTLHWVPDHPALIARLARVLRPGAGLHVDCGGEGNIAEIAEILADLGAENPWTFSGVADTERSLAAAGFGEARVWLSEDPVEIGDGRAREEYLATVILGSHLAAREADEGRELVREVAARMTSSRVAYVRLNIDAWLV